MEQAINYFGLNQFLLYETNNNSKVLINVNRIIEIILEKNIVIIKTTDKNYNELFSNESEAIGYYNYLILAISEGNRVISRLLYNDRIATMDNL